MILSLRYWGYSAQSWLARRNKALRQTCPRRMRELGPWKKEEGLDFWESRRWGSSWMRKAVYAWNNGLPGRWLRRLHHKAWKAERYRLMHFIPNPSQGGVVWEWPWQPRTCSFCGGVHPADVVRLMEEGWEVEGTNKMYKRYLQPPGYDRSRQEFLRALRREELDQKSPNHQAVWRYHQPVPPVKMYVQHFSDEQIQAFNEAWYKYTPDSAETH